MCRYYASFSYQAQSWEKPRPVVAKVEWHPGDLYPRVGFVVTNLTRPAKRVVAFYNRRGTAEQCIKAVLAAVMCFVLCANTRSALAGANTFPSRYWAYWPAKVGVSIGPPARAW